MTDWDKEIASYRLREQFPALDAEASAAGWQSDGQGNYRRAFNGVTQTLPAAVLAQNLQEQKQASQLSTPVSIGGGQNYLQQIQQYLQPQQQAIAQSGQQLSQLGASAGMSSGQYSNPYEQRLAELINNPNSIENSNAYKFRFNQGQQALERSAAARGMLNSGNTLAALTNYGQGAASEEYGNEYNRLNSSVGQRNQYNLGLMGASNQELGLRQQGLQDQNNAYQNNAGTALRALIGYDENTMNANRLAASNAVGTGRINAGQNARASTW